MAKKLCSNKCKSFCNTLTNWKGSWIVSHLGLAAVILLILGYGSSWLLDMGTRHGETLTVPDFEGMTLAEARSAASNAGVRIEVIDSIYVKEGRGTVARQNPLPGSSVKEGRRILIVMRAKGAQKIAMPNLVGYSTRQALAELEARGLEVGRLTYDRSVPTTNNVLKQKYKGREIQPGDSLEAESAVDLVLGLGRGDDETMIPDVIGKKGHEAKKILHDYYLNVKLKYDRGVKSYSDRSHAVVYKQTPEASDLPIKMGSEASNVTLYLRLETAE